MKTDFAISVDEICTFPPSELVAVRRALPDEEALDEKVRILSYEIVKPSISDRQPSAFLAMKTRDTPLTIRLPHTER